MSDANDAWPDDISRQLSLRADAFRTGIEAAMEALDARDES